jgi:hypothetical protein
MLNMSPLVMPQTKLKMLAIAAKSREIEGMDAILQELEAAQEMIPQAPAMQIPGADGGPTPQGNQPPQPPPSPAKPQQTARPQGAPAASGVLPFPSPQR